MDWLCGASVAKNIQPKDDRNWTPRQTKPNAFGSQIRSYVMDRNEVIDHRTGKRADVMDVLSGKVELIHG